MRTFLLIIVLVSSVQAQPAVCVPSQAARAFPRLPVQLTQTLDALEAKQGGGTEPILNTVIPQVPTDRFLVIDNIAVKGVHPGNTYLAIELRTAVRNVLTNQWAPARHFLYTRATGNTPVPLEIRTPVRIFADARTAVQFGLQRTVTSRIEPITITLTGTLVDVCEFGR